jgi:hypothetical protein
VAAWIDFCFRSTLSFTSTSGMNTGEQLAREDWSRWKRCFSGLVAKASWKKNKNSDNAELGWKWSFRIGGSG